MIWKKNATKKTFTANVWEDNFLFITLLKKYWYLMVRNNNLSIYIFRLGKKLTTTFLYELNGSSLTTLYLLFYINMLQTLEWTTLKGKVHILNIILQRVIKWVSEWLVFNANWKKIQLYHGENNLHFNEMIMLSVLY